MSVASFYGIGRMQMQQWSWNNVCAAWILFVLLAIYTVGVTTGFSAAPFMSLMVSLWSMKLLFVLPLLLLIPALQRWWAMVLVLLPVLVCFIWQMASLELYAIQCRFLSFEELGTLWSHDETRPLITEQIFSWSVLFFTLGFFGIFFLSAKGLKRILDQRYAILVVPLTVLIIIIGYVYVAMGKDMGHRFKPARLSCMVWSRLNTSNNGQPIARLAVAKQQWTKAPSLFWKPGVASYMNVDAAQYKDRGIVVILMESHGVHYLDGIGDGSEQHKPSSPYLAQLAREHIYFNNYFHAGYVTHTAAWSLLCSFPYFNESAYTPQLARLGLIPAFQQNGYTCEWIQSTTPLFANFNELTHNIDMFTGVTKSEAANMREKDDALWSAWGMPDEQIFEVAYDRLAQRLEKGLNKYVQIILTVSNHNPYYLPEEIDGVPLLRDPSGGMRYADACLKAYMEKIAEIDEAVRPIVFITADTGFRSIEHVMFDDGQLGAEPLESMRIPGVLVLPGAQEHQLIPDMFCHEDVLPFLAHLTGVDHPLTKRLQSHQRTAVVINDYEGHSILEQDYYFFEGLTLMSIKEYWKLTWLSPEYLKTDPEQQAVYDQMHKRFEFLNELRDSIWKYGGDGIVTRDQRWEVIDSYEKPKPHDKRQY